MTKKQNKKKKSLSKDFLSRKPSKINRNQRENTIVSDLGTPELENHYDLGIEYVDSDGEIAEPGKGRKRAKNLTQTTLDYLKRHGLINDEQHNAGERLYWDCYMSGLVPRAAAAAPDGIPRGKTNKFFCGFAEGRVDCQTRYIYISSKLAKRYVVRHRTGKTLQEPEKSDITFWDVTYQICIKEIAVDALEKWTDWPRRSGKKLISLVLDELFDLYEELHRRNKRKPRR